MISYLYDITVIVVNGQQVFLLDKYLLAIERAFSTSAIESTNSIYFIQT